MRSMRPVIGVDVGARALHAVSLAPPARSPHAPPEVADAVAFSVDGLAELASWCAGAGAVAVDAPERPVTEGHACRWATGLPKKFELARCAEVEAAAAHDVWVPWVTPPRSEAPPWMRVGFALWAAIADAGTRTMETYPAGCFLLLNGGRWPASKRTPAGRRRRVELLAAHVRLPGDAGSWGHDVVDAALAALIAYWGERAEATPVTHHGRHPGADDSVLWLPPGEVC